MLINDPNNQPFQVYDDWKLSSPVISPRSELYHLPPIGVGTALVESLSSYFRRLAIAHCVNPPLLFQKKIVPLINKSYLVRRDARVYTIAEGGVGGGNNNRYVTNINGTGVIASDWLKALEILTLRRDLNSLTMITWGQSISGMELFRDCKAWCPNCYDEWRTQLLPIYEPLLWHLRSIEICPQHLRPLSFQCPSCQQPPRFFSINCRLGFCSRCDNWLGENSDKDTLAHQSKATANQLAWEKWSAENVGALLAVVPSLTVTPKQERIKEGMKIMIECVAGGNAAKFASSIGKTKSTVWGWTNKNTRIRLYDLLVACYYCQISPIDFLVGEPGPLIANGLDTATIVPRYYGRGRSQTRATRGLNKEKIRSLLESILRSDNPPMSFNKVGELLKVSPRYLRQLFPATCVAVSNHCKRRRKFYREEKTRERRQDIELAISEIRSSGRYPSRRRVVQAMKDAGKTPYDWILGSVLRNEVSRCGN